MKVLIVVLVLIAFGFTATIVYGVARTQPGTSTGANGQLSGAPPTTKDGEVDQDALENWRPPNLLQSFGGIGRRFSKGIEIDRPTVTLGGYGADQRAVPSADTKKPRIAKLALASGTLVQVIATQPGKDDAGICLCLDGAHPTIQEQQLCGSSWLSQRIKDGTCQSGADSNNLAFDPAGGQLRFRTIRPATVQVQ